MPTSHSFKGSPITSSEGMDITNRSPPLHPLLRLNFLEQEQICGSSSYWLTLTPMIRLTFGVIRTLSYFIITIVAW